MNKQSSLLQRGFLKTAIMVLTVLLLVRICNATTLSNIDLSTTILDPATTGFWMVGNSNYNLFGYSVKTAGDIDGDGYSDMIVGADMKIRYRGSAYVIYGGPNSNMSNLNMSINPNPKSTGFMISGGADNDHFGYSVSTAGDVDNDGYDDIIIGAYGRNAEKGAAYVIYGGPRSAMSNIDLNKTALDPATTGFNITGTLASVLGGSVGTAGDINNDGYGDIIIGAPFYNLKTGAAYVIYGGPKSKLANIDLSSTILDPATTGFMISGEIMLQSLGWSVSTAGDINHDGYGDIIIGTSPPDTRSEAYVIYGGPTAKMTNIDLKIALDPATTGFKITGNASGDEFGWSVNTAGDLNGDGYGDIIIGAHGQNNYHGAAYVIYGGPNSKMSNIELRTTTLDPATTGFLVTGTAPITWFGYSVASAGDINNDGYGDIIVGADYTNRTHGAAYVIYGGPNAKMSNIDLSSTTLDPATTGLMITGSDIGDMLGWSVSTAGDINNDGYGDIIVGAAWKDLDRGTTYVIYGGDKPKISAMSNIAV